MDIKGLDYNTQRERLILPEYGREVQEMVQYAVNIPDRRRRQRFAEMIVGVMSRMSTATQEGGDRRRKLWDHLALLSDFQLDIDYPFDTSGAARMAVRPQPVPYPMKDIPVRHYGNMMFEVFDRLKEMAPGKQRDHLVRMTANQMKRDLMQWSHGSADDEKVADDLARFTDGKIQLDLDKFRFERPGHRETPAGNNRNNRRKR